MRISSKLIILVALTLVIATATFNCVNEQYNNGEFFCGSSITPVNPALQTYYQNIIYQCVSGTAIPSSYCDFECRDQTPPSGSPKVGGGVSDGRKIRPYCFKAPA